MSVPLPEVSKLIEDMIWRLAGSPLTRLWAQAHAGAHQPLSL